MNMKCVKDLLVCMTWLLQLLTSYAAGRGNVHIAPHFMVAIPIPVVVAIVNESAYIERQLWCAAERCPFSADK